MVSFWPWKGEDNSPASFEKTLSALATKISSSQAHLDCLHSNQRRYKALWTLYTTFIYLFGLVVLVLVIGWKNWSIGEGSALAGFPVFIAVVRTAITSFYTYRIDSASKRLEGQLEEQSKTIEKLKAATKYNSTLELLEKYGAAKSKTKRQTTTKPSKSVAKQPQRIPTGPPLTANIPRQDQSLTQRPSSQPMSYNIPQGTNPIPSTPKLRTQEMLAPGVPGPPEFAPNAFNFTPEYIQTKGLLAESHWYDRMLDLLLGEDETLPKNRLALICQKCRLVNGLAPPGTKSLNDLGNWRCLGCGTFNWEDKVSKSSCETKESHTTSQAEKGQENNEISDLRVTSINDQQALETSNVEETVEDEMIKNSPKSPTNIPR